MSSDNHFTYELHDIETDELLYIGRSVKPKTRRRIFERRTGREVTMVVFCHLNLEAAQRWERRQIYQRQPPYNKYVASSPTRLGMTNSAAHCAALSKGRRGKKLSAEHKSKLWAERDRSPEANPFYGKKHTKFSRTKISKATKAQFSDPEKRLRHKLACEEAGKRIRERNASGK